MLGVSKVIGYLFMLEDFAYEQTAKDNSFHDYSVPGAVIIEGHVQGLSNTRALGARGIPIYVVDKNDCIAKYSKYCVKFFRSPDFNDDALSDFLIEIVKREKIKNWVLIPSNDHAVYTLSKHKDELKEHFRIITPGLEIINKIYDKIELLTLAKGLSIPIPETQAIVSA